MSRSTGRINTWVLCSAIVVLMFPGCKRGDSFDCSQVSEMEFEKSFKCCLKHIDGLVELRELAIPESISNAYFKAAQRKRLGVDCHVIPVYCSIQGVEALEDSKVNCAGCGFRLEIRNFGERIERRDLNNIWLIVVLPSHSEGYCDVLETSLANITRGMGSSWSDLGFGDFWCRCNDPRLGWGSEKVVWNALMANGLCKMYLLLDDGIAWGRRHGRTFHDASKFKSTLEWLNKKGVLTELVVIAASEQECVLECR